MNERTFPVSRGRYLLRVPWDFLAAHESQAQKNHSQSLERLAQRGGLGASEMLAIVSGISWSERLVAGEEDRLMYKLAEWLFQRRLQPQPSEPIG